MSRLCQKQEPCTLKRAGPHRVITSVPTAALKVSCSLRNVSLTSPSSGTEAILLRQRYSICHPGVNCLSCVAVLHVWRYSMQNTFANTFHLHIWPRLAEGCINAEHRAHGRLVLAWIWQSYTKVGFGSVLPAACLQTHLPCSAGIAYVTYTNTHASRKRWTG